MKRPIPEGVPDSKWRLEDHDYTGELSSDAGSEVARLNQPFDSTEKLEDPRDGAIILREALEAIRDLSTDGISCALYAATVRAKCKEALKLAKGAE
jgi:hypothetical protein